MEPSPVMRHGCSCTNGAKTAFKKTVWGPNRIPGGWFPAFSTRQLKGAILEQRCVAISNQFSVATSNKKNYKGKNACFRSSAIEAKPTVIGIERGL
jgi:hypothetical protein